MKIWCELFPMIDCNDRLTQREMNTSEGMSSERVQMETRRKQITDAVPRFEF